MIKPNTGELMFSGTAEPNFGYDPGPSLPEPFLQHEIAKGSHTSHTNFFSLKSKSLAFYKCCESFLGLPGWELVYKFDK